MRSRALGTARPVREELGCHQKGLTDSAAHTERGEAEKKKWSFMTVTSHEVTSVAKLRCWWKKNIPQILMAVFMSCTHDYKGRCSLLWAHGVKAVHTANTWKTRRESKSQTSKGNIIFWPNFVAMECPLQYFYLFILKSSAQLKL